MAGGRDGGHAGGHGGGQDDRDDTDAGAWPATRAEIARRLPPLLDRALAVYADFAAAPPPADEAKAFAAYQASCRAALGHVLLLVRLAEWARAGERPGGGDEDLDRLIEAAEAALARDADADDL